MQGGTHATRMTVATASNLAPCSGRAAISFTSRVRLASPPMMASKLEALQARTSRLTCAGPNSRGTISVQTSVMLQVASWLPSRAEIFAPIRLGFVACKSYERPPLAVNEQGCPPAGRITGRVGRKTHGNAGQASHPTRVAYFTARDTTIDWSRRDAPLPGDLLPSPAALGQPLDPCPGGQHRVGAAAVAHLRGNLDDSLRLVSGQHLAGGCVRVAGRPGRGKVERAAQDAELLRQGGTAEPAGGGVGGDQQPRVGHGVHDRQHAAGYAWTADG